jgi:hypothetical protein
MYDTEGESREFFGVEAVLLHAKNNFVGMCANEGGNYITFRLSLLMRN